MVQVQEQHLLSFIKDLRSLVAAPATAVAAVVAANNNNNNSNNPRRRVRIPDWMGRLFSMAPRRRHFQYGAKSQAQL